MATRARQDRITRDDLAAKLRELEGGAREQAESARPTILTIGAVVGVVLLLVAFALGRRAGKQRSTVVEIRRV